MRVFKNLLEANRARQELWGGDPGPLFRAVELGGEVGEVLNVVKKLEREKRHMKGSRATKQDLADEIGDAVICLFLLADTCGIDAMKAAAEKFNKTSRALGFPVEMEET